MSNFQKILSSIFAGIEKTNKFIPATFVIALILIMIPIVYGLTIYHWTYYVGYKFLFFVMIMLLLQMIYTVIVRKGIMQWLKEEQDWINKINAGRIYFNVLYLSIAVFSCVLYVIVVDYTTCFITICTCCTCRYEDPYEFMKAIVEVIGSGLIPVLGLIFQQNNNTKLDADRVERYLLSNQSNSTLLKHASLKEESPQVIENISNIFVDATREDIELANQVIDCLKNHEKRYLPPIIFQDSEINIHSALQTRLDFCGDVFILCGSEALVLWVKNRLRFYLKYKQPSTEIFVLCSANLKTKFDTEGVHVIEFSTEQCNNLISEYHTIKFPSTPTSTPKNEQGTT